MSTALFSVVYSPQFIRFGLIVTVAVAGSMLILAVRDRGAMGATITAIGVATILMSSIIQGDLDLKTENIKAHLFWWDQQPQKMQALEGFPTWSKIWSPSTGTVCILLGMISAYRPGTISVRNRLPFDYPYPVWKSSQQEITQHSASLVPLKSLLSQRERLMLARYRLILVMIESRRYLVKKGEMVPEECTVIRTADGKSICGM